MQEGRANEPSKLGIVKLAIPLSIALVALLIYNFQSINSYQQMSEDIRNSMFNDPALEALLLTYRDNHNVKELTINVKGVTGELGAHRAEVIKFICNSPFLSKQLEQSNRVDIKLTASERKNDKYLEFSVTRELCLGIS